MSWVLVASPSFSGSSQVNIDNCFSADYKHYLIMRNMFGSVTQANNSFKLRSGGTTDSSTNYEQQYVRPSGTSATAARATSQSVWSNALGSTETYAVNPVMLHVSYPYSATWTVGWSDHIYDPNGSIQGNRYAFRHTAATSWDGFTITPSGGTITGTIYIYGLRES